ncbi:extracellular solute-binding protein [Marmoricola sp. RAF53]|uniref:extracellular solute-binding protein n=1 Tax=Marmoricola sp. RAF53 TaxID=3233059 RepID=UPI003F97A1CC
MIGRSRVLAIGATVGALALTAACSGNDAKAEPSATPTPQGPALITLAVYGPPPVISAYAKIAADFTAGHKDIVVNVRPYDNRATAEAALAQQIQAGNAPDAFLADQQEVPRLVEDDAVQSLDELLGERQVDFGDGFQRNALEAYSSDNALQCMPVDVSPLVAYVNTDLVDLATLRPEGQAPVDAESGWKLDDLAAAAQQASLGRVRGLYVSPDLNQVAPFVWSGGGEVVDDQDEPTTLTLSSGASSSAMEQLLEVVRDPQTTFTAQQIARRSALQRFKAGQLAVMFGYRDLTPQLRTQQDLHFDVLPMPRIKAKATSGDSRGLCLSKTSEHKEATADFLAYAVSTDAMSVLASTGYVVPTNVDVANSDAFLQPAEEPVSASVFVNAVRTIRQFPTVETWPSVAAHTAPLLAGLFYDPVIDPLEGRLKAIDAASVPLFTPIPTPSPSPSTSPSASPSAG